MFLFEICIRVLISPKRWYVTLFFQSPLISQLYLNYFGKVQYYTLGNRNYLPWSFPVVLACEKLSQRYFISFVHPMLRTALQLSFFHVSALAQWHFVLVGNYQVKFCQKVKIIKKNILSYLIIKKAILSVVQCVFQKIKLCSQVCVIL